MDISSQINILEERLFKTCPDPCTWKVFIIIIIIQI